MIITEKDKAEAEKLANEGYIRTSNKFRILSRPDRSDWREQMAMEHAPWDISEGRAWVRLLGDGAYEHYCRVYTVDKITVSPGVFAAMKNFRTRRIG